MKTIIVKRLATFGLLWGLAAACASGALAATCTATPLPPQPRNWGTASTWSCGNVPASGDNVVVPNGATVVLNVNSNRVNDLQIDAGGVLRGDGTNKSLTMNNGTGTDVTNNGTIDFGEGNLATMLTRQASTWTGTGSWTFSTINLNGNTLNFVAGTTANIVMSGAAAPFTNAGAVTSLATITWDFSGTVAQTLPTSTSILYGSVNVTNTAGTTLGVALTSTNILGNLTVASNGILNNGGFAVTLAAGKSLSVQASGTLNLTGTSTMVTVSGGGTKTFDAASTVNYAGSNQNVTAETYGNLGLTGSASKTIAAGTTTIAGSLTLAAGVTYNGTTNNPVVNLKGNFDHSGTFNSGTGTFTFNGTAAQNLTGAAASTTFTRLAVNNASGLTIGHSVTASTLLTLTSGVVTTNANTLTASTSCPGGVSRTGGWVAGFLRLTFPGGASTCTFDVGDASIYRPASVTMPAGTTTGAVTGSVSQSAGEHPNITDATSDIISAKDVNRYWTLTNAGVGVGAGGYGATFNFVAGDVDAAANTSRFQSLRWGGVSWATTTVGTRTGTSTQISGVTAFGDFAVGQRGPTTFAVTVPASPVATCAPQTIGITAKNSGNSNLTNYVGTINITTSTSHGDWTKSSASGTLNNGTADDGAASYVFVAADNGSISLNLTSIYSEVITITVTESLELTTGTSASLTFQGNQFAVTAGTVQVAKRPQAMTAQLNRGSTAGCNTAITTYAGSKNLKAWLTLDANDPGGARPSIGALTLPTSIPAANNLTLTFTSGATSFQLNSTDIGKYVLNLRDDSTSVNIDGASSTIVTRPFAVVVQVPSNSSGTATGGSKLVAAADAFQATVAAYVWSSAADGGVGSDGLAGDGVPDAGATLAQIIAQGTAASYRSPTTLSAGTPITPASGSVGSLTGGAFAATDFSGGSASKTLTYSEVGSFTMTGTAASFLGTLGLDLAAIVFNGASTPARNAVVGRFYPDHFTLVSSSVTPACPSGNMTYMGQPNLGYGFTIEARNKAVGGGAKTSNYDANGYSTETVSVIAENGNNGTDLSGRLSGLAGLWTAGTFQSTVSNAAFSRPASPDGPFDSLQLGVAVSNTVLADGALLQGRDMNPTTAGDCVAAANCTGKAIGGATAVRFGRMRVLSPTGSSQAALTVPMLVEYWNGGGFAVNTLDSCTTLTLDKVTLSNFTGFATCATIVSSIGFTSGSASPTMSAPGAKGSVDLRVNLGAASGNYCPTVGSPGVAASSQGASYLQGRWDAIDQGLDGNLYDDDPSARVTFGVFGQPNNVIFRRENF
jgi:uncharacterized protein DUF6701/G8 domain-containing protein